LPLRHQTECALQSTVLSDPAFTMITQPCGRVPSDFCELTGRCDLVRASAAIMPEGQLPPKALAAAGWTHVPVDQGIPG
jgi:hypothetical protein